MENSAIYCKHRIYVISVQSRYFNDTTTVNMETNQIINALRIQLQKRKDGLALYYRQPIRPIIWDSCIIPRQNGCEYHSECLMHHSQISRFK